MICLRLNPLGFFGVNLDMAAKRRKKHKNKFLGGIAIDITEIKRSEQKLRNAYEEIKQLVQIISPSHNMSQNMRHGRTWVLASNFLGKGSLDIIKHFPQVCSLLKR